jgi:hypothetical protein
MNEKRRRGEPELILAKITRALILTQNVIDESLYSAPNGHARILPLDSVERKHARAGDARDCD